MADSILRLRVDSSEYDQKIKRAAEGIQQYAQKCREAGGTLQYLDDGVLEFVKSLGKMDTVATTTKQQMREMSNALTTLTMTYRGLTDEEKASPFGQELAKGIQQLTERAGQAKDAMMDVEQSIKNAASDTRMFDQMAQGMSVATAGFQGLTGAGKLLGIEMGNDVEVIAKLQAAMAVTNSLTTIQNALQKQSALMQGLNAAKTSLAVAAQQAYAVATGEATVAQAAFNVAANANPYMLIITAAAAAATAIYAYCEATDDAEEKQKALNVQLENARTQMEGIKTDSDFNVAIAKAAGESENAIRKMRLEAARARLALADMTLDQVTASGSGATKEQIKQAQEASQAAWREVKKVLDEMTVAEVERLTKLKTGPEVVITPNHKATTTTKAQTTYINSSIGAYEQEIADLRKAQKDVTTNEEWEALQHQIGKLTIKVKELKGELKDVPASISDATNKATDAENKKIEDRLNDPSVVSKGMANIVKQISKEQGKEEKKYLVDGFGKLAGGLGGIQSGFQQMGIDLGDGFNAVVGGLQGITTILTAIQAIVSAIEIISSADAILPLARGGVVHAAGGYVVPGHQYSGDLVPAALSSGEMVLNKQQQMILSGTLENSGMKNISISGHLEGETIALSVDRWGKRSGRGELAFWKNQ